MVNVGKVSLNKSIICDANSTRDVLYTTLTLLYLGVSSLNSHKDLKIFIST